MKVLAIDPGPVESAYCLIDGGWRPLFFGKVPNREVRTLIASGYDHLAAVVAIEQIGHYGTGMPAGRDVFDTCRIIGRFEEALERIGITPHLVKRATVKTALCGSAKAKDSNVTQALVDRFTPGEKSHGKGTKADPGWFYGFAKDVWQAYALAVYVADRIREGARP